MAKRESAPDLGIRKDDTLPKALTISSLTIGFIYEILLAQLNHMKTTNAFLKIFTLLLLTGTVMFSNGVSAQNLITNPGFESGTSGWGTDCSIEIYTENVYGGTSSSNMVTEIDVERCFNQQVAVSAGAIYDFSYKASRRTGGGTPGTVGVNITITGVQSGTEYLNTNKTYSNTTWGFVTESFSFTLPTDAIDSKVNIKFSSYLTTGTYGTIVDDINFNMDPQSSVLPIKLMSFAGQLKNKKAMLTWTASNDDIDGEYFIAERAPSQGGFDSIGVVAASGTAYSFTDNRMLSGSNNYRLRIVNRASATYSKIISLDNTAASDVQVYPNPATTSIGFKLNSTVKNNVNVIVYSLSGSVVSMKQIQLNAGLNASTLDVTSLRPGSFFLKICDDNGMNYVQEFCKR